MNGDKPPQTGRSCLRSRKPEGSNPAGGTRKKALTSGQAASASVTVTAGPVAPVVVIRAPVIRARILSSLLPSAPLAVLPPTNCKNHCKERENTDCLDLLGSHVREFTPGCSSRIDVGPPPMGRMAGRGETSRLTPPQCDGSHQICASASRRCHNSCTTPTNTRERPRTKSPGRQRDRDTHEHARLPISGLIIRWSRVRAPPAPQHKSAARGLKLALLNGTRQRSKARANSSPTALAPKGSCAANLVPRSAADAASLSRPRSTQPREPTATTRLRYPALALISPLTARPLSGPGASTALRYGCERRICPPWADHPAADEYGPKVRQGPCRHNNHQPNHLGRRTVWFMEYSVWIKAILTGATVAATMLLPSGCGTTSEKQTETFTVQSALVTGSADDIYDDANRCAFYDGTLQTGDTVVLRGADNSILATSNLTPRRFTNQGTSGACAFDFQLQDIKAGEAGYQLTVGDLGPVIVTEDQLRRKSFRVVPRGSLDVLIRKVSKPLEIEADDG